MRSESLDLAGLRDNDRITVKLFRDLCSQVITQLDDKHHDAGRAVVLTLRRADHAGEGHQSIGMVAKNNGYRSRQMRYSGSPQDASVTEKQMGLPVYGSPMNL